MMLAKCPSGSTRVGDPAIGSAHRAIGATMVVLALALVCIPTLGCAQRPAIEWQEYFTASALDRAKR